MRQVIQLSVRGDEAETPLAERPEWRQLLPGPVDEVFARFAAQNAALMARTAPLIALGEAAAASDPELAEYRDQAHAETRANLRALTAELNRRGALNPDITEQDAADTIYALATDESVFLRLTRDCGWTVAAYANLIACALDAALANTQRPPQPPKTTKTQDDQRRPGVVPPDDQQSASGDHH
jgi:hypothetical protein